MEPEFALLSTQKTRFGKTEVEYGVYGRAVRRYPADDRDHSLEMEFQARGLTPGFCFTTTVSSLRSLEREVAEALRQVKYPGWTPWILVRVCGDQDDQSPEGFLITGEIETAESPGGPVYRYRGDAQYTASGDPLEGQDDHIAALLPDTPESIELVESMRKRFRSMVQGFADEAAKAFGKVPGSRYVTVPPHERARAVEGGVA